MISVQALTTIAVSLLLASVESFAPVPSTSGLDSRTVLQAARQSDICQSLPKLTVSALVAFSLIAGPGPAFADGQTKTFKLPPIDLSNKSRCVLKSSGMGQANAARDSLFDLRMCKLSGAKAVGFDLSGVIMTDTDVSNANFQDAYFSKGYLHESNFDGTDFSNAVIDRASFTGSSLKGTIFTNAVLTGTTFDDANLEGADFTDSYIGDFGLRALCKNPTLKGQNPVTGADTRISAGCK